MPIPSLAVAFDDTADPYDIVEWVCECAGKILEAGEEISSFTLTLDSAAAALGVSIVEDGIRDPVLIDSNSSVKFWLEVDDLFQDDPAFNAGAKIGIVLSINTNSAPSRRRQRTWVATVVQQ